MLFNETKKKIFLTAVDMFSSLGYSQSTMRVLASRIGVKPASLYYYYASKEELLEEIFEYFMINDTKYRTSSAEIIDMAKSLAVSDILKMMYVRYVDDDDFYIMTKIIRIAIGYQYESERAKEIFNRIFYEKALEFRVDVFAKMVELRMVAPFDYKTVAYLMTSYSIMRFMECMNRAVPIEKFTGYYNQGVEDVIRLIVPLIKMQDARVDDCHLAPRGMA